MSETLQAERCAKCPDRTRLSCALARFAGTAELAPDCEGPITVSHGEIHSVEQSKYVSPDRRRFPWIFATYGEATARYSMIKWNNQMECGRSPIEPKEGEVPYDDSRPGIIIGTDGLKHAAFIRGSEEDLMSHGAGMALFEILSESRDESES